MVPLGERHEPVSKLVTDEGLCYGTVLNISRHQRRRKVDQEGFVRDYISDFKALVDVRTGFCERP